MAKALYFNSGRLEQISGVVLEGVATPVATTDAANKAYVDSVASGLDVKASVRVATTAAFAASTYANGTAGVGATLTRDGNGVVAIDGVTIAVGDRVLVKNQAAALQNGIYVVTAPLCDASNPLRLTRATDADQAAEVTAGMFTFVAEGTANADKGFVLTSDDAIVMGTNDLTFAQFSSITSYTEGTGIDITGAAISLDLAGLADTAIAVAADYFVFSDASDSGAPKKELVSDFVSFLAGTVGTSGLVASSGVLGVQLGTESGLAIADRAQDGLVLDLNGLAAAAGLAIGDSIAIVDASASNVTAKVALSALAAVIAGSGLTTAAGQLVVSAAAANINSDAVTTVKILDANVTAAKLAPNAVQADSNDVGHLSFSKTSAGAADAAGIFKGLYVVAASGKVAKITDITNSVQALAFCGLAAEAIPADTVAVNVFKMSGVEITPGNDAIDDNGGNSFTVGLPVYLKDGGLLTTTVADITDGDYLIKVGTSTSATQMVTEFGSVPVMK